MKVPLNAMLILLATIATGCHRESEPRGWDLASFTNNMGKLYDSVSLGMVRSNVYEKIGRRGAVRTNVGPYTNWVMERYVHDPEPFVRHYPDIWSGLALTYSNGVLVQKEHIVRKGQP
jgi:hypothetical protein